MIREITLPELTAAQSLINAGVLEELSRNLNYFKRQIPNELELIRGFKQSYDIMNNIVTTGESGEFSNAQGGTTVVTPDNAVEEAAITAIYTVMMIINTEETVVEELRADLGTHMNSLYQQIAELLPEQIAPIEDTPEDLPEEGPEDLDDDYDDGDYDESDDIEFEDLEAPVRRNIADFTDEELEDLLSTPDGDEELEAEDNELDEEQIRQDLIKEFLNSFIIIDDDGSDKPIEKFNKRDNDPEYYEDIRRPHEWQQNLSIDRDTRVGINIYGVDVPINLVGWKND